MMMELGSKQDACLVIDSRGLRESPPSSSSMFMVMFMAYQRTHLPYETATP